MSARSVSARRRFGRLVFTLLMTVAWSGAVPFLASRAVAQPAGKQAVDPKAIAALLKRVCAAGEQELRKPGADPSDVPSKAAELGFDLARSLAFVRDEVAYEPYLGLLRGARGALAARAGNALDKALLLQGLLRAGGHQTRLVRGQLPPEKAAGLLDQYLKRPAADPAGPAGVAGGFDIPAALAEQIGVALPDLQASLAENRRAADQFLADATAGADVEAKYLQEQLAAAGLKPGRTYEQWVEELKSRAADHYWLELTDGGGSTVLDPTLAADAVSGPPTPVLGGRPVADADLVKERHTLRFQFVYATGQPSQPAEQVLLDVPLYADEALYEPPMFSIEPADPVPPASKLLEMQPEAALKLLTGFKNYQAVLRTGGRRTTSPAFDLKGTVTPVGADGRVRGAQQLGGATGGLFGGGALGGETGKEEQPNNFVSMGVVMTLQSPGAAPDQQRRLLLVREQTTGDEFMSPILEWKMLVQPQPLTPALAGYASMKNTLDVLRPILPALDAAKAGDEVLNRLAQAQPSAYPEMLMNLAGYRQSATAAVLKENASVAALWDRPQVAIVERRFCANAKAGRTCGHATIDIVENALSYVPRSPEAGDAAARCALRQGVFDTVAEALTLERMPGATGASGAITDLRAAREAGGRLAVAGPGDAAALASTTLSESDRQWIAKNEGPSRRVAAPDATARAKGAVASAWWSIDLQTGRVLGRRDGGRGQALHEYIVQITGGAVCMLVSGVLYKKGNDFSEGKKNAFIIGMVGCVVGAGLAGTGVGASAAVQSTLTAIGIVIGALLNLWAADVGS